MRATLVVAALTSACLAPAGAIFPDQAGLIDRMKMYVGAARGAGGAGKHGIVFSSANTLAGLNLATGKHVWRKVLAQGEWVGRGGLLQQLPRVVRELSAL